MVSMKWLLILLLNTFGLLFFGQVEGYIYNNHSLEPQAYANIHLVNTSKGCVSNSNGAFSLRLRDDQENSKIRITAVGIEPLEVDLSTYTIGDTIWVSEQNVELAELTVYNNLPPAIEMVRIALNKLPDLGYRKPYSLSTFYRHYCSEKGEYGRLIEAALVLTDNKGHNKKVEKPADKIGVEVLQQRRSYDFTENFDEHEPISIYSTLKYDVMSYPTILSFYPEEYNFRLVDTTFMDNKLLWVIQYDYDKISKVKLDTIREQCSGRIFINSEDNGVYLIEEKQTGEIEKTYETQSMVIDWRVQYQQYEGFYFLKYVSETSHSIEELRSTQQEVVQTKDHKAHVEMMVNDIRLFDVKKNYSKEPSKEELDTMKYDREFWGSYTMLKKSPLDEKILEDLAKRAELGKQFEGN